VGGPRLEKKGYMREVSTCQAKRQSIIFGLSLSSQKVAAFFVTIAENFLYHEIPKDSFRKNIYSESW
jgi:hypothetical protein